MCTKISTTFWEWMSVRVVTFSESGRRFLDFSTHYYLIKLQISFKSSPLQKSGASVTFFGLAVSSVVTDGGSCNMNAEHGHEHSTFNFFVPLDSDFHQQHATALWIWRLDVQGGYGHWKVMFLFHSTDFYWSWSWFPWIRLLCSTIS